mmetsp:Transcript_54036/g.131180  ORF Transcript_54036/g.131180 Transcript_54036/m.131180 type:complete len:215 (+) Transcript_54036:958-1602(+)
MDHPISISMSVVVLLTIIAILISGSCCCCCCRRQRRTNGSSTSVAVFFYEHEYEFDHITFRHQPVQLCRRHCLDFVNRKCMYRLVDDVIPNSTLDFGSSGRSRSSSNMVGLLFLLLLLLFDLPDDVLRPFPYMCLLHCRVVVNRIIDGRCCCCCCRSCSSLWFLLGWVVVTIDTFVLWLDDLFSQSIMNLLLHVALILILIIIMSQYFFFFLVQ